MASEAGKLRVAALNNLGKKIEYSDRIPPYVRICHLQTLPTRTQSEKKTGSLIDISQSLTEYTCCDSALVYDNHSAGIETISTIRPHPPYYIVYIRCYNKTNEFITTSQQRHLQ